MFALDPKTFSIKFVSSVFVDVFNEYWYFWNCILVCFYNYKYTKIQCFKTKYSYFDQISKKHKLRLQIVVKNVYYYGEKCKL